MMRTLLFAFAFLVPACAPVAPAAPAAAPAPVVEADTTLDAAARRAVVDSVTALLDRYYAVPDTGRMIAGHVEDRLRSGAYDGIATVPELAEVLTEDLRAINDDLHLLVKFDPTFAASLEAEANDEEADSEAARAMAERARRDNFGVHGVERLEGNIGYLNMGIFYHEPQSLELVEHALRVLESTDAVILDLRNAPGGSGTMSNFLISHFTEPGIPSLRVHWRPDDRTVVRRTLDEVPGPRRTDVPLYVLTGRGTASAAEDVAFVLQNLGRATIVGDRTAGAGRNNMFYPVGRGLAVSISISRVQDPETGREWERVGVQPDIRVADHDALAAAHLAALEALEADETHEARRRTLAATREYVNARYRPARVATERLAAYAGRYGDGAEVKLDGGVLYFRSQPTLPFFRLVPVSGSEFLFGPDRRVGFTHDAEGTVRMEVRVPGKPPRTVHRTG